VPAPSAVANAKTIRPKKVEVTDDRGRGSFNREQQRPGQIHREQSFSGSYFIDSICRSEKPQTPMPRERGFYQNPSLGLDTYAACGDARTTIADTLFPQSAQVHR
jgi:hypothetical protein